MFPVIDKIVEENTNLRRSYRDRRYFLIAMCNTGSLQLNFEIKIWSSKESAINFRFTVSCAAVADYPLNSDHESVPLCRLLSWFRLIIQWRTKFPELETDYLVIWSLVTKIDHNFSHINMYVTLTTGIHKDKWVESIHLLTETR